MRVLLITATYPPSINGNALSVFSLKEKLQEFGHKVLVIAPSNGDIKTNNEVIRYAAIPNPLVKDYPIPLSPITYKTVLRIKKFKPDLIHVHHPYHIGFAANILAKQLKIPLVFTYHTNYDFYAKKYLDFLPKKLREMFLLNGIFEFCKHTNLVIAPSESIKRYLKKKVPMQRVVTSQTIINDLIHSRISKPKLRIELSFPLGKKILLIVSRLSPEKNIELAIKAMKPLSETHYLVICGAGLAKESLQELVAQLNLDQAIFFAGRVSRKLLGKYYSAADYLINTSISETQGINLYEALSFGLPIISVDTEVAREWVNEKRGLLCKNNISSLVNAIKHIDKKSNTNLSKNARIFAKKFTPEKSVKIIIKEYERLIKANNA